MNDNDRTFRESFTKNDNDPNDPTEELSFNQTISTIIRLDSTIIRLDSFR